jgi:two-component system nitrogen regulation sensor histidine kinase NtrY
MMRLIRKLLAIPFEHKLVTLVLAGGLPALAIGLALLWSAPLTPALRWTLALLAVAAWIGGAAAVHSRVIHPLQTVANLLGALRQGDYSTRGRVARPDDALGVVFQEVNLLGETLKEQRLHALEAGALLRAVMTEIDVAVLAFDREARLKLANRAGERLLARPGEKILGKTASELGLSACLEGDSVKTASLNLPGGGGRWGVRTSVVWEQGLPHRLVVLADLTQALRTEELNAWKRLVRVMGHELNNSLAPIKSIAGSLRGALEQDPPSEEWKADAQRGLAVIGARAEGLARFLEAYSKLAKLPAPKRRRMEIGPWVRRVIGLETRAPVRLTAGPDLRLLGDADQLDQLLINLVRNAVEATLEANGGAVEVGWLTAGPFVELFVRDEGPGIANPQNLFVPFFTTKPGGSGIGLVLCRQIAEAHGGTLALENRRPGPGCEARLRLPL